MLILPDSTEKREIKTVNKKRVNKKAYQSLRRAVKNSAK
jgi:hypothetical protein